jgi:uncharacterized protein
MGCSVAVGVLCGCTPFIGLHMWMALGLATLLRLNRLWAFLGSRISFNVVFAWVAFSEVEVAHKLRTGQWMPLDPADVLDHGRRLFGDWMLGSLLVGPVLAVALGLVAYGVACRWRLKQRTLDAAPPPSSGSPRSAPPAPTP